jgi:hypothetical protein
MYISAFPLRATVVYDDVPDVGVFYDDAILKLVVLNEESNVRDKVLLRKQLRCLNEQTVFFPIQRWEKRKVKRTVDGKRKEVEVLVLISYNWGSFRIMQTEGKDTRTTEGFKTEFDVSAGFAATLKYADGYGSTREFDGGTWVGQQVTVGHDVLGISDDFKRGTASYEKAPTSVCC